MSRPTLIVGCGPSAVAHDLSPWRGKARVIVINESWVLAPWADILYACDRLFWMYRAPERTAFAGRRMMRMDGGRVIGDPPVHQVAVLEQTGEILPNFLGDGGGPGWGGNSGFQALNLAVQLGASRSSSEPAASDSAMKHTIVGVGLDFNGGHWHPHGADDADPPGKAAQLLRWARTFDAQAPRLAGLGVRYIDTSPHRALSAYEKMTLPEAFAALNP